MSGCYRSLSSLPDRDGWIRRVQSVVHNFLGLAHNRVQVRLILEALRIDLVDVLRARGARRKPAAGGRDFQTTDWGVVAWGVGQLGDYRLTSQARLLDGLRRQLSQPRLLLRRCGRVDTCVVRCAELGRQFAVVL